MNRGVDALWFRMGVLLTAASSILLVGGLAVSIPSHLRATEELQDELVEIFSRTDLSREEMHELVTAAQVRHRRLANPVNVAIPLAGALVIGVVMIRRSRANANPGLASTPAYRARDNLARWPSTRYATFWPRLGAGLIDGFTLSPIALLAQLAANYTVVPVVVALLHTCLAYGYTIWLHSVRGQTAGKWLCRLRVVDDSGEGPLRRWQPWARDAVPLLLGITSLLVVALSEPSSSSRSTLQSITGLTMTLWFVLEVGTMLLNSRRRALHDFIAGTVVVRVPA